MGRPAVELPLLWLVVAHWGSELGVITYPWAVPSRTLCGNLSEVSGTLSPWRSRKGHPHRVLRLELGICADLISSPVPILLHLLHERLDVARVHGTTDVLEPIWESLKEEEQPWVVRRVGTWAVPS